MFLWMRIADKILGVLVALFPSGYQRMALQSVAVERLRQFPSIDVL
jgi:hypothetical protein